MLLVAGVLNVDQPGHYRILRSSGLGGEFGFKALGEIFLVLKNV